MSVKIVEEEKEEMFKEELQEGMRTPPSQQEHLRPPGPELYQVLAPKTDIQLLIAMSQCIEYFRAVQSDHEDGSNEISRDVKNVINYLKNKHSSCVL